MNVEDMIVDDRVDAAPSVEERRQAGRLARAHVPRSSQADRVPPDDRPDPVAFVREADRGRVAELLPLRYARMAASPFAFLRGAAALMASDLSSTPTTGWASTGVRRRPPSELRHLRDARTRVGIRSE